MSATLAELAAHLGCELRGEGSRIVNGIAPLESAGPDAVTFLARGSFRHLLEATEAAAVILRDDDADYSPVDVLVSANPYADYARTVAFFHPDPAVKPGIHPTAVVAADADIDPSAEIGPFCVIGPGARIGANTYLGPHCTVAANSNVGSDCRFWANVHCYHQVTVGDRVIAHAGTVIGADGFGFARDQQQWVKIPQIGSVRIGDDVELGACTTVDRGALADTVIERGVKLDNHIQIGHGAQVGEHTAMAAYSGVGGSGKIGRWCTISGDVSVMGHLEVADNVNISAKSLVTNSIKEAGSYSAGLPIDENSRWRKNIIRFKQLDDLARRLKKLERGK